ncbi:hypothetical protein LIER_33828 [Lithospermum erythrorhizon]|uniref:Integrase catalytic domain-containing protein n=1 Tax=Lithospermum erythrorhizon TaxID=34254 RepID=A0AAV3S0Z9_LITER
MEYALRFSVETTNNEAEYEAMIAGLMLIKYLMVPQVLVRADSKLIMDRVKGECGVKNENMIKYHEKAVTMTKDFEQTVFEHVQEHRMRRRTGYPNSQANTIMSCQRSEKVTRVEYAVVAIDYFNKWVGTTPLKKTKGYNIVHFVWKHIIMRFGVSWILVSDNAPQFEGNILAEFYETYGIEQRFSPIYYPQSNGQVELMNHIVFTGLKKNFVHTGGNKGTWPDELPTMLWSLPTTPSHATGETPFALVYGMEAVLPVEVGLPFDEAEKNQRMREDLNFTDELRKVPCLRWSNTNTLWPTPTTGGYRVENSRWPIWKPLNHTWHATKLHKYYS